MREIKKVIVIAFFILSGVLSAQDVDSLLKIMEGHLAADELTALYSNKENRIYTSLQYQNKSIFGGAQNDSVTHNFSFISTYGRNGFYAGLSGHWYPGYLPAITDAGVFWGYSMPVLGRRGALSAGYAYTNYFFEDSLSLIPSPHMLTLGAAFQMSGFYGYGSYYYIPGDNPGHQVYCSVKYSAVLLRKRHNFSLSMEPETRFYFGNMIISGVEIEEELPEKFGLINTEILLGVSCVAGNIDLRVSGSLHISQREEIPELQTDTQFTVSMGYLFSF